MLSVGIGVGGHASLSGHVLDTRLILLGMLLVSAYGWLFAEQRFSARALFGALALVQIAIHLGSGLLATPATADQAHSMHHMTNHAAGSGGSVTAMLAVHLMATALGMFVLLRLERWAWTSVRDIGSRVARTVVRWVVGPVPARAAQARVPLVDCTSRGIASRTSVWLAATCGRRGPPILAS